MAICVSRKDQRLLNLINAHRVAHGVPPLVIDAKLHAAATKYARIMGRKDHFSYQHLSPDGTTARERVLAEGYPASASTGENILYGQPDPGAAFTAWRDSSAHNANMLSPNYQAIGIGGPVDKEWSYPNDVFEAWATSFGSVFTARAPHCRDQQPEPDTREERRRRRRDARQERRQARRATRRRQRKAIP